MRSTRSGPVCGHYYTISHFEPSVIAENATDRCFKIAQKSVLVAITISIAGSAGTFAQFRAKKNSTSSTSGTELLTATQGSALAATTNTVITPDPADYATVQLVPSIVTRTFERLDTFVVGTTRSATAGTSMHMITITMYTQDHPQDTPGND